MFHYNPKPENFYYLQSKCIFSSSQATFPPLLIQQDMILPMIKISHLHMKLLSASFKKMLKDEKLFLILKLKHSILKLSK